MLPTPSLKSAAPSVPAMLIVSPVGEIRRITCAPLSATYMFPMPSTTAPPTKRYFPHFPLWQVVTVPFFDLPQPPSAVEDGQRAVAVDDHRPREIRQVEIGGGARAVGACGADP